MKKIIVYILLALILILLSFLFIKPTFIRKALLNNTVRKNVGDTSGWETYQLDKQYKNAALHFKLSYPREWQPKEEGENVAWYSIGKQKLFTVSWFNPDFVYDVESVCRVGMCNKISEVSTSQNITIEILKPIPERQKSLKLSNSYLQGEIVSSNRPIIPNFTTDVLSVDNFKAVLTTFSFTD